MNEAYSGLAKVYEYLICDDDYKKWADYLVETIQKYAPNEKGVDCACGSGYFTRALKRGGFDVCGVDFSNEMLCQAEKLTAKEGMKINYRQMDMTNLKTFEKVGFITIINDGVNYVSKTKLSKMFSAFHRSLCKDGILFFDISSEYKLKNIIGNNLFGEDDEFVSYLWFNKLFEDRVEMDISLFLKDKTDGKFVKQEENHVQYIHTEKEIRLLLEKSGFKIERISEHLGKEVKPDTQRLEFVARKK